MNHEYGSNIIWDNYMFEIEEVKGAIARIKVIGVGGCGCHVINSFVINSLSGVEFIAVNTGTKSLNRSLARLTVQIGKELTKGDGAGGDPEKGRLAALKDKETLMSCLEETDIVFIIAGMGKGTGTGAAPVIASIAKEKGVFTIAAVIKPFFFEGRRRFQHAEEGLRELTKWVDAFIIIPNDKICPNVQKGTPLLKSFEIANDALRKVIAGILDVILSRGFINTDIADLRTIMKIGGRTLVGMGSGKGEGAAVEAAKKAVSNPLLEGALLDGVKGILVNITGGPGMSLDALKDAASLIYDIDDEANIILGTVIDEDMEDEVRVTLIASGVDDKGGELFSRRRWTPNKKPIVFTGAESILSKDIARLSEHLKK